MELKKHKYKAGYLLILLGCLLFQYALCLTDGKEEQTEVQAASMPAGSRRIDTVNPFQQGIVRAAETSPFTFMFRLADNLRSFVRLPARNMHQSFSFENVILLYSVRKKSLSRIFIRKHASSTSLLRSSSCRFYVFALREILV
ncbi:MAG: hypothetical protein LBS42_11205 [Tannerella sp.]|jgi:hypothetical protein|nr:hypothetical protein [Tannerella sp.]